MYAQHRKIGKSNNLKEKRKKLKFSFLCPFGLVCLWRLTPLSAIFQ
jgi:hypothetical protein